MRFLAFWWLAAFTSPSVPKPTSGLAPAQVVRTVFGSLQNNNSPIPNAGVYTAYSFASPANRAVTGPYGHFLQVVKTADYRPLLHRYPSEMGDLATHGDSAQQIVTVYLPSGGDARFEFRLQRQSGGSCPDCWLIDGVSRLSKP